MKITIGIFAHVDAGKTTFSETILFLGNKIKKRGNVDTHDTVFDHNSIEKRGKLQFLVILQHLSGERRHFS